MVNNWVESYKNLVVFLGGALGENYEIVLHVLVEPDEAYIGAIVNNHISGRSKGAPLTNLALEKIKQRDYKKNDSILNYKVIVKDGKTIYGSTFYIKDEENNLLGLLCINADFSKHKRIVEDLLSLTNLKMNNFIEDENDEYIDNDIEFLSADIEEIINNMVDPLLLDERVTLNKDTRLDIIKNLEEKGVFQLKGAIGKVANLLKISEPTIYRYLQEIKIQNPKTKNF